MSFILLQTSLLVDVASENLTVREGSKDVTCWHDVLFDCPPRGRDWAQTDCLQGFETLRVPGSTSALVAIAGSPQSRPEQPRGSGLRRGPLGWWRWGASLAPPSMRTMSLRRKARQSATTSAARLAMEEELDLMPLLVGTPWPHRHRGRHTFRWSFEWTLQTRLKRILRWWWRWWLQAEVGGDIECDPFCYEHYRRAGWP